MKKNMLIIPILFFLSCTVLLADIIDDNSHLVKRCVKITNLAEFPGIVLIGYITGPGGEDSAKVDAYAIQPNTCLTKEYKFNHFAIYAMEKKYFDYIGLEKLTNKRIKKELASGNVLASDIKIEPESGYAPNKDPLVDEYSQYSVAGFSGNKIIIYKSKEVSKYNNGSPDKVETFNKPNVLNLRLTIK